MLEREDVLKLAKLSRLEVADGDIDSVKGHLDKMLDHMEALKALDLSNVEPMTAVDNGATILREDVPVQGFSLDQAFANAPAVENDHFAIPKVIGG
ncbi:Asp-tRNA(Asn)/Glu-tRNA(Gln) amidotransferase subunit GatC [Fibrobacter sp. UBA4309]|uniref:Asp-tRNA(Asn)/Glu-tRNA(Gln) amidotransferase subunit GatC n=1 Tax=Fibrobacter sp. UBA4309 TaxID=1946537 RepID=UPI0025C5F7B5|nr:Asp-tRNA(Asn)/Glu-tRNA(Gln) amidotransferase subunit GatC [Fibrobacter sp. UBA4309]